MYSSYYFTSFRNSCSHRTAMTFIVQLVLHNKSTTLNKLNLDNLFLATRTNMFPSVNIEIRVIIVKMNYIHWYQKYNFSSGSSTPIFRVDKCSLSYSDVFRLGLQQQRACCFMITFTVIDYHFLKLFTKKIIGPLKCYVLTYFNYTKCLQIITIIKYIVLSKCVKNKIIETSVNSNIY